MTIAEKIKQSEDATLFTLYREGIFYKCYNEDAMVFSECVRAYKISIKFVKNVGVEVMSLGFPASEVEKENLRMNEKQNVWSVQQLILTYRPFFLGKDGYKSNQL